MELGGGVEVVAVEMVVAKGVEEGEVLVVRVGGD